MEKNNAGKSLLNSIKEPLIELGSDVGELSLDQALGNGLLADIPIFGFIAKGYKLGVTIKNHLFAKKVMRFLWELHDVSSEERGTFIQRIENSNEEQELGDTLILLLDRHENFQKSTFLAQIMKAYIRDQIDRTQFDRLSTIIDRATISNLTELIDYYKERFKLEKYLWHTELVGIKSMNSVAQNLYMAGLSNIDLQVSRGESLVGVMAGYGGSVDDGPIQETKLKFVLNKDALLFARITLNKWG